MKITTSISNKEIVKDFLRLQYEGKIDEAFNSHAHDDFQWVVSTADNEALRKGIPWAGYTHHGKEGYESLIGLLFGEFESLKFEVNDYYEAEDKVFAVGRFRFKHYETKKVIDSDFIGLFNMDNGKIKGGQFYENTYAVAQARS